MMKGGDHVNRSYSARVAMRYGENLELRNFGLGARACRSVNGDHDR